MFDLSLLQHITGSFLPAGILSIGVAWAAVLVLVEGLGLVVGFVRWRDNKVLSDFDMALQDKNAYTAEYDTLRRDYQSALDIGDYDGAAGMESDLAHIHGEIKGSEAIMARSLSQLPDSHARAHLSDLSSHRYGIQFARLADEEARAQTDGVGAVSPNRV